MNRRGGMSVANQYDVEFAFSSAVSAAVSKVVGGTASSDYVFKYFCDEAQLPNVSTMTGQLTGRYTGMGTVAYAHTPTYTEFQLGWMCDANMTPLKVLTAWHDYMIGNDTSTATSSGNTLSQMKSKSQRLSSKREFAIKYPDDYTCDLRITKVEMGQTEDTRRPSITYLMERVFPISIDAVPLSYGNSQLTRVTATFQYSRHQVYYNTLSNTTLNSSSNRRSQSEANTPEATFTNQSIFVA